jgi:hypothetical protein
MGFPWSPFMASSHERSMFRICSSMPCGLYHLVFFGQQMNGARCLPPPTL